MEGKMETTYHCNIWMTTLYPSQYLGQRGPMVDNKCLQTRNVFGLMSFSQFFNPHPILKQFFPLLLEKEEGREKHREKH